MLIVLLDEPGLFVFPSRAEAERDMEPIDAESIIRAAHDEYAVPYRVEWRKPNRHRDWLLGLASVIEPGDYGFVPAGPPDPSGMISLLKSHLEYTNPPDARPVLLELLAKMLVA